MCVSNNSYTLHTITEQISAGIENISDGQEHKTLNTKQVMENPM